MSPKVAEGEEKRKKGLRKWKIKIEEREMEERAKEEKKQGGR